MRKISGLFTIILLISMPLFAASDTASFEISAYHIDSSSPGSSNNTMYIEIGDATTGGILSSSGIDITDHIEGMLADFKDDGTVDEAGNGQIHHPEEIVFSYLIHSYGFVLTDGTDMSDKQQSDAYTFTVSVSPFMNDSGDVIKSSYRLMNTTHAFDDGSLEMNSGVCNHAVASSEQITATLSYSDSSESHFYPSGTDVCSQSWRIEYSKCNTPAILAWWHNYEHKNDQGYSIRGAISFVFDRMSYANAPTGTYSSIVTLTLTTGN